MKRKLLGPYIVIDPDICHGKPTFIRRFKKHKEFNTQAKRLGKVTRVIQTYISMRERYSKQGTRFEWAV